MARTSELGGGGGFPKGIGAPKSDSFLLANYEGLTIGSAAITLTNLLIAVPLFVSTVTIVDGLAFDNTTTGDNTETVRLGLYGSTTGGRPGALLGETGVITLDATADVRVGAMGAAVTLLPSEMYWLAINGASGVTILQAPNTSILLADVLMTRMGMLPWNLGGSAYDTVNTPYGLEKSHAFGALPNPFGTPSLRNGGLPVLGVQVQ